MNRTETATLLAHIAQIDNRHVSAADVNEWLGLIGDLTYGDCHAAVVAHRQESEAWLMPAHVRKRVLAARQDRAMRQLPAAGSALPPGAPGTFGGLPIPGRPIWAQRVYEQAKAQQREINATRKAQGLLPTYGQPDVRPVDRMPGRRP